jgi:hypothetical protein
MARKKIRNSKIREFSFYAQDLPSFQSAIKLPIGAWMNRCIGSHFTLKRKKTDGIIFLG